MYIKSKNIISEKINFQNNNVSEEVDKQNVSDLNQGLVSNKNMIQLKTGSNQNQFHMDKTKSNKEDNSIISIAQQDNLPKNNFKFNKEHLKTQQFNKDTNLFDFIQKIQSQPDIKTNTVHNLKDIKNLELRTSQD